MNRNIFNLLAILLFFSTVGSHAQYQKVTNNDLDIYFRIFGEGTPILIIGGGPGDNSNRYLSLCELLSTDFQCILVDQRVSGKSSPTVYDSTTISVSLTLEDFEIIRKNLDLEEWAVLGFSYGGYLASLYTHYYPSSVSDLILLESMGLNIEVFNYFADNIISRLSADDMKLIEFWNDSSRVAENFHHAITEQIRAKMPGYFYDRGKSFIVSSAITDSDFNFEMGLWIWNDVIGNDLDLAKMGNNFDGPVLILSGRQDPVGESIPRFLNEYYKNSELHFIERSGHYSWIEQPDTILSLIKSFLGKSE
jgi:proline iminopeptidase